MRKFIILSLLSVLTLTYTMPVSAQTKAKADAVEDVIIGKWYNEQKNAKFEIYKEDGKFYAKIYWLKRPKDPKTGKPKTDINNPEESLRNTPLIGLVFMKDLKWDGEKYWDDGKIYQPASGSTYDSYMWLDGKDTLKVKGYIGLAFIGKTTTWTRVK